MQFLTLLFVPHIIIWILTRSRRAYRWLLIVATFTIQLFAILPMVILFIVVSDKTSTGVDTLMLAGIYEDYRIVNPELHGASTFSGIDISAGCGAAIYAPFAGEVTANHIDYQENTILTIVSGDYELTLAHGDYVVDVGEQVRRGQMVGVENTHGYSDGCHSHVILKQNGRTLNYLDWMQQNRVYAVGIGMDYPLRISWYDPSLGGTNCDHDCTTMASGDKVASWIGGRGGVFAAACPRSDGWHHGQRFELDGVVYECRDTGGWINCYQPGMYDPALRRDADMAYCWVDLLNGSQYQYGSLAYDWRLIR